MTSLTITLMLLGLVRFVSRAWYRRYDDDTYIGVPPQNCFYVISVLGTGVLALMALILSTAEPWQPYAHGYIVNVY